LVRSRRAERRTGVSDGEPNAIAIVEPYVDRPAGRVFGRIGQRLTGNSAIRGDRRSQDFITPKLGPGLAGVNQPRVELRVEESQRRGPKCACS
jgi:hypothetical protein